MQLHEEYRPAAWDQVIGQPKALRKVCALAGRGLAGRAYWISGNSGTGKSTIAYLLAAHMADDRNVFELDAAELTPAHLTKLHRTMGLRGLGQKWGRAYIVNEAHGLRRDTIRQLLVLLEKLPPHVIWVFTTTTEGQQRLFDHKEDASPLLSRCIYIALARRGLSKLFAQHVHDIAEKEGLNGKGISAYVDLARTCHNNMRAMLQAVECGEMLP